MNRKLKCWVFSITLSALLVTLFFSWYLESSMHGLEAITEQEILQRISNCTPANNEKGEAIWGNLTINSHPAPYDSETNCYFIPQPLSGKDLVGEIHWSNLLAKTYFVTDGDFEKSTSIEQGTTYQLYVLLNNQYLEANICFTGLPALVLSSDEVALQLYTNMELGREGKFLRIFDPDSDHGYEIVSCGVATSPRGGQSLVYEKPQYRMDLYAQDLESLEISVLGLPKGETLLLSAQEYESTKIRDAVARDIWNLICDHTKGYGNYYTPSMQFCEVFEDDRYLGLYGIMLRSPLNVNSFHYKDALIKLKVMINHSEVQEKMERDPKSVIDWTYLNQFSGHENALWKLRSYYYSLEDYPESNLLESFYKENIIDYFLYLNSISAVDNEITNCFFYQPVLDKDLSSFYRIPWDLDRSFGHPFGDVIDHDPALAMLTIVPKEIEQLLNTDHSVWNLIQERWFDLRESVLSEEEIQDLITEKAAYLESSGAYLRDFKIWGHPAGCTTLDTLMGYTKEHLLFLDDIFSQDTPEKLFESRFVR